MFIEVFLFLAVLLSYGHDLLAPLELLEEEADPLPCCVQLRALEVVVLLHLVVLSLNVLSLHHPLLPGMCNKITPLALCKALSHSTNILLSNLYAHLSIMFSIIVHLVLGAQNNTQRNTYYLVKPNVAL